MEWKIRSTTNEMPLDKNLGSDRSARRVHRDAKRGYVANALVQLRWQDGTGSRRWTERFLFHPSPRGLENQLAEAHGEAADYDALGVEDVDENAQRLAELASAD